MKTISIGTNHSLISICYRFTDFTFIFIFVHIFFSLFFFALWKLKITLPYNELACVFMLSPEHHLVFVLPLQMTAQTLTWFNFLNFFLYDRLIPRIEYLSIGIQNAFSLRKISEQMKINRCLSSEINNNNIEIGEENGAKIEIKLKWMDSNEIKEEEKL